MLYLYETEDQPVDMPLEEWNWVSNRRNPDSLRKSMETLIDNANILENLSTG